MLVDSRAAFATSVNVALAANGLPPRAAGELHRFLGPPLHATFRELGAGAAVQSCVDDYRAHYAEHSAQATEVVAGIPEALDTLGGEMELVVATSKPQALAVPLLEALGLRKYFRAVVGPDLATEHESKAATIGRALEHFTRPPRGMVGDRSFDVVGARAHDLPTIGVLWGIGDADELVNAGAVVLARTPAELAPLVRSL